MAAGRVSSGLMHFGDPIIIFVIALILFGPKKLPELARQLAKLMAEFRRASNEFKIQIDEELRSSEQMERQKQISAPVEPMILPPSVGEPVSQYAYNDPAETERPDRSLDSGWGESVSEGNGLPLSGDEPQIGAVAQGNAVGTDPHHVNGALGASMPGSEGVSAVPPELAMEPASAEHNEFGGDLGGLFKETSLTFGAPSPVDVEGEAGAAIVPVEPVPQTALEGSASENAQAIIHHG